jgi:multiple sugar transport system ATP-binding protein
MGRAIVRQPKAFLFDEPLSNLDALLRSEMRVEIKKLHHRLGNTIIYVTHDQVEAMTLADRIVVLHQGNLVQYDTPDGIYNRPAAKFVAGFTGSPPMNFTSCRVGEGGRLLHIAGGVDLPVPARCVDECARHIGRELTFGLRPEHIGIPTGEAPGIERIDGKVLLVEPLGAETLGLIKLGASDNAAEVTGRFEPDAHLRVGQNLPIALDLNHFHLFDSETGLAIRGADW